MLRPDLSDQRNAAMQCSLSVVPICLPLVCFRFGSTSLGLGLDGVLKKKKLEGMRVRKRRVWSEL